MKKLFLILTLSIIMAGTACSKATADPQQTNTDTKMANTETPDTGSAKVRVKTTLGNFTVLLYGDTPKHRDNFLRLAKEHYYDSTLFHRVIKNFMVQAGDPDSKTARPGQHLGAGGPDYKIDAEIVFPAHFHKRGALAAARQGDMVNPMRQSSGSQFYIVTGDKLSDAQFDQYVQHLDNSRRQRIFNELAQAQRQEIMAMQQRGDTAAMEQLRQNLIMETTRRAELNPVPVSEQMRQAYTTVGGAPHLDGDYTVFGEVIDGMDVIDRIENVATGAADRPVEDVRILKMEVLD